MKRSVLAKAHERETAPHAEGTEWTDVGRLQRACVHAGDGGVGCALCECAHECVGLCEPVCRCVCLCVHKDTCA